MFKNSPMRAHLAALTAEVVSAIRLTTAGALLLLALVILTLVPLNIVLWELAL